MSCLLAFWVPLCILSVYDLEPSSLGFFLFLLIIYLLFIDKKKKEKYHNQIGLFNKINRVTPVIDFFLRIFSRL